MYRCRQFGSIYGRKEIFGVLAIELIEVLLDKTPAVKGTMLLSVNEALEIIHRHKRVAIVGLSPNKDRPSHKVAAFLMVKGFEILPVNPGHKTILGRSSIASLADLEPEQVDWIDLFVSPQRLADLANDIIRLSPMLVWCQIGVVNDAFNRRMQNAQIPYIIDVCPKMEWQDAP